MGKIASSDKGASKQSYIFIPENVTEGEFDMASSKKASEKVKQAVHEQKRGTLKSGQSGKKVKSRKQAIAIGLSQARSAGAKGPKRNSNSDSLRQERRAA